MKIYTHIVLLISTIGCIAITEGCVTATESIISNHDNGIHKTQLNQYTYLISYKGHSWNTPEEETRILLSEAAEITKQSGYQYFSILSSNGTETNQQYTSPSHVNYYNYGYGTSEQVTPGQTFNFTKHTQSLMFQIVSHPINTKYLIDSNILLSNNK